MRRRHAHSRSSARLCESSACVCVCLHVRLSETFWADPGHFVSGLFSSAVFAGPLKARKHTDGQRLHQMLRSSKVIKHV